MFRLWAHYRSAADYPQAFKLYMSALDHFTIYLKYEKNPMMHQTIKARGWHFSR
jgi:hypothetical protein